MGKLITMLVFKAPRSFENVTEEDAARQRGFNDWMASRFGSPETLASSTVEPECRRR